MAHFRADLLISLLDVWVLDGYGAKAKEGGWLWCPWTPVDQEPVPPLVLKRLEGAHTVLPYAKHGETEFRKAGMRNVRYIPHGVVCDTFKPLDRYECRAELGLPARRRSLSAWWRRTKAIRRASAFPNSCRRSRISRSAILTRSSTCTR